MFGKCEEVCCRRGEKVSQQRPEFKRIVLLLAAIYPTIDERIRLRGVHNKVCRIHIRRMGYAQADMLHFVEH
jgi:hypothetical protein